MLLFNFCKHSRDDRKYRYIDTLWISDASADTYINSLTLRNMCDKFILFDISES